MDDDRTLAGQQNDGSAGVPRETMTALVAEIKRIVPLLRGAEHRRSWDDLSLDEKDARLHERP
jgi:hypothetical protein